MQGLNKAGLKVESEKANPSLSPANQTVAKGFYTVNPVNPVQCFHGGLGRKLGQDEQDGQDAEMEDQELPEGIGAGVKQGEIEG